MAIEAVLFDIGGVLEVAPPTGWQDEWSARLGIPRAELDARLEPIFLAGSTGQLTLAAVEGAIANALGLEASELGTFMEDLWTEYVGTLNERLAAYFAQLRPQLRTGILSNSFVGARERERERYGFEEMCDAVVYSHEEGLLKPDARFYRVACARLGTEPATSVLVDDVQTHVDGARAAGMHAIMFVDNAQVIRELDRLLGRP